MKITLENDNKMLTACFFTLYLGLCFNYLSAISVLTLLTAVAFYGAVATLLIQPLFHIFYGMSAYKDVKIKKKWGDLKVQLEILKSEIPEINIPSMSYKLDPSPNAFAISGLMSNGLICVHSGLLDKIDSLESFPQELIKEIQRKLKTEEEPTPDQIKAHLLRSVLAHEVGHLYYNHGLKKTFLGTLLKFLSKLGNFLSSGTSKFVQMMVKNFFISFTLSHYSRDCETQADSFAAAHGYAQGLKFSLIEIFTQNKKILDFHSRDFAEPYMKSYHELISTHPCQAKRIGNIDEYETKCKKIKS